MSIQESIIAVRKYYPRFIKEIVWDVDILNLHTKNRALEKLTVNYVIENGAPASFRNWLSQDIQGKELEITHPDGRLFTVSVITNGRDNFSEMLIANDTECQLKINVSNPNTNDYGYVSQTQIRDGYLEYFSKFDSLNKPNILINVNQGKKLRSLKPDNRYIVVGDYNDLLQLTIEAISQRKMKEA